TKHFGGGTSTAAATIQNDIVCAGIQSKLNVFFNMVRTQLKANRDSASHFANAISKFFKIFSSMQVFKGWRRYRCLSLGNATNFRNFPDIFIARKMSACSSFCTLPALEMKSLNISQF